MRVDLIAASAVVLSCVAVRAQAEDAEPSEGIEVQALTVPLEGEANSEAAKRVTTKARSTRGFLELEPLFVVGGCSQCRDPQPGISVAAGWVPAPWLDLGLSYLRVSASGNAGPEPQNETAWSYWAVRGVVHPIPRGVIDPRFGVKVGAVTRDHAASGTTSVTPEAAHSSAASTTGSFVLGLDIRCLDWLKAGVEFERLFSTPSGSAPLAAGVRLGVEF